MSKAVQGLVRGGWTRRRRKRATEFLENLPAAILEANSTLGAAALDRRDLELARLQARVILTSPLGGEDERERALRLMFAVPASEAAAKLATFEETLKGFQGELPPAEAGSVDWEQFVEKAGAAAAPFLEVMEEVTPEAGWPTRDQLAEIHRQVAFLGSRSGSSAEITKRRLETALSTARGRVMRGKLERETADSVWASLVSLALTPLADGKPNRAFKKLRILKKIAETDGRRKWVEGIMGDPTQLTAKIRWRPLSFCLAGAGLGYWGRRVVDAKAGTFVSSHGLLALGFPVATQGAYLRKDTPHGPKTLLLGRVPGRFAPRQYRAALALLTIFFALLLASGVGYELWSSGESHSALHVAANAIDDGRLDVARKVLLRVDEETSWLVRKRRDGLIARELAKEIGAVTTARSLDEVVRHADELDHVLQSDIEVHFSGRRAPAGIATWFTEELDREVLAAITRLPPPVLSRGGGRSWSEEREPWDREAEPLGKFLSWACRRSAGLHRRRAEVAMEAARRFEIPHLWALALSYQVENALPSDQAAVDALERFLLTSQYGAWADDFRVFEKVATPERAAAALDARCRPVWLGLDWGWELRDVRARLPPELVSLMKVPSEHGWEEDLRLLEYAKSPGTLQGKRAEWHQAGWRRRHAHVLLSRTTASLDPQGFLEAIEELRVVTLEIPEDEDSVEFAVKSLQAVLRHDEAIDFAESRPTPMMLAYVGLSLLSACRVDQAVEPLERFAKSRMPEIGRLQRRWQNAIREACAKWAAELNGSLPDSGDQMRVFRIDKGDKYDSPAGWLERLARADPESRMRWVRCLVFGTEIEAIRGLARAHAALSVQGGEGAEEHAKRALEILRETSAWEHPSPAEDRALLGVLEDLRSQKFSDVVERTAREGTTDAITVLAGVADQAGLAPAALRLHAAAWERLPEQSRIPHAAACAKLETDLKQRATWFARTGVRGALGSLVEGTLELAGALRDRRWPEAAAAARRAGEQLRGFGDSPQFHAGSAGAFFAAWVAGGDVADLENAASEIRGQLPTFEGNPRLLTLSLRILYCRACVELSNSAIHEGLLHGFADARWTGYARPALKRDDLVLRARENEDLRRAGEAARLLIAANPADLEGWKVRIDILRLQGDVQAIAALKESPELELAPLLTLENAGEVLKQLWPLLEQVPEMSQYIQTLDEAVVAATAADNAPALSRALVQRAQLNAARHVGNPEDASLAAAIDDAEHAVRVHATPEGRQQLIRLLAVRAARDLASNDAELQSTLTANSGAHPLLILAAVRELAGQSDERTRENADLQRAADLAERELEDLTEWTSVETVAALALADRPRTQEASKRLDSELVERECVRLRQALRPGWSGGLVEAWLAARYTGETEEAGKFAELARELGSLEGVIRK